MRQRLIRVCILLGTVVVWLGAALSARAGPQCPNWSSKFDGITNQQVVADLRGRDWDALIEQAGGPSKVIVASRSTLKDATERLANAQDAVRQLAADERSRTSKVTWEECKDPQNALMAAKCEVLNMSEMIMSLEGTIELAQCRRER